MKSLLQLAIIIILFGCTEQDKSPVQTKTVDQSESININKDIANQLIQLPLKCIQNEYPYKSGLVIAKEEDLQLPIDHHPVILSGLMNE